ncbi:hypothetical protein BDL97_15G049600 [Sphagnum fallax]|nr:hypothetical protein BDL97_15G049600 [Sphagnum fallax]KAH8939701.1 hypothetical protein BDL97_15G049600 [Sphagnum fallax]
MWSAHLKNLAQGPKARIKRFLRLRESTQFIVGYQYQMRGLVPQITDPRNGSSTMDHNGPGNGSPSTDHGTRYSEPMSYRVARVQKSLESFENNYNQALPRSDEWCDFSNTCRDFALTDSEDAAILLKDGVKEKKFLPLTIVKNVVGKIFDVVRRPVEIINKFVKGLFEDPYTMDLVKEFLKSADQVKLFCSDLENCISEEIHNQDKSLKEIIRQMDGTKASGAAGFSCQQRLKKVLQSFSEERNDFMNGTLLGKLEPLMQLFQKHKPMFEECLLKMQQKRRLASLAVGFSRGIIVCLGVASLICTLLVATLVMAPIGMLNIGFYGGLSGGQALLQLAKEYRKQLKSESALACRSMHGTTTAIHELAELQEKIQHIIDQLAIDENARHCSDYGKISSLVESLKSSQANLRRELESFKHMATQCKTKMEMCTSEIQQILKDPKARMNPQKV